MKKPAKKQEVSACIKCGSTNLLNVYNFSKSINVHPLCSDCGNRGAPILFDSVEDYEKFLKAKRGENKEK